jgi:L-lactate dehydrogenase complex protein LldF
VDLSAHRSLPFASTLCGSCKDVCPVRIDIPEQLLAWRARIAVAGALPKGYAAIFSRLGKILANRARFELAGRWARRALRFVPTTMLTGRWNPWTRPGRQLPPAPAESFREWARREGRAE